MLGIALLLVVLVLAVLIILWTISYKHYYGHLKDLKGPNTYPLIGMALEVDDPNNVLWIGDRLYRTYGKIIRITGGFIFAIGVTDVNFLEHITSSPKLIKKSMIYEFFADWLGNGLLNSDGDYWRTKRKLLTPAYHFKILENFISVFERNTDILIEQLKNEVTKSSFDIFPHVKLCALDIICETAMGTTVNAQLDANSAFVLGIQTLSETAVKRVYAPHHHNKYLYKLSDSYRRRKKALTVVHGFRTNVIKKRRDILLNKLENPTENKDSEFGIKQRKAFLDILLESSVDGRPLTDQEINEEVDTFMFEGHDTVSAAIAFALFCLSNNPDVQGKVWDEQKVIFSDDINRNVTFVDVQEMKYLEMVIKETLRLYPSVPMILRDVTEDFYYKDMLIKKGMQLILYLFTMQRDPDYFPNPEQFDPERFSIENQSKRNPFSFLGFSAGPRNCIGQRFAMLEMKTVLSKIVRKYELLPTNPVHKPKLASEMIITSLNGIWVRIRHRQ